MPLLIKPGEALVGSHAMALMFVTSWDKGGSWGNTVGTAKPWRLRPRHKQHLQQDEILGQREVLGHEASFGLWCGQSWAIVPIWAGVHIWAINIWAVVLPSRLLF